MNETLNNNGNKKDINSSNSFNIETKSEIIENLNSNYKENIDFVFKQNPKLAQIGTKKQYSEYLNSIFPESKVKNILYHRGPQTIEVFNKSKIKEKNENRFYFSPLNTGRYGQYVTMVILNIQNLAEPFNNKFMDNINKEHPEYSKGKSKYFYLPAQIYVHANKYGYDGVFAYKNTNDDEYSVYSPEQIHILGSKKDIKKFKEWISNKNESNF